MEESEAPEAVEMDDLDEEAMMSLRRNVRRLLNCVSEAQMSRTISELVGLFSDRPRATVRTVLIEEIDVLLKVCFNSRV